MVQTAFEHCRRITTQYGHRFYQASLFLPEAQQRAAWAVYAFCRVSDNLADEPISNQAEHFARWREVVMDALDGRPQNQVLESFAMVVHDFSIPPTLAMQLLDGVAMDLHFEGFATLSDLEHYAHHVASVPGLMMARVFGASEKADSYAVKLGLAMQLTNVVRDVKEDAALGRVYLPEDLMAEFGLSAQDVLDDPASQNLHQALCVLSLRAQSHYAAARPGLTLLPKPAQACAAACLSSYAGILDDLPVFCPTAQTL